MREIIKTYDELGQLIDLADGFNMDINHHRSCEYSNKDLFPKTSAKHRHKAKVKTVLLLEVMKRISSKATELTCSC
jgi:hypothetical protein